MSDRSAICTPRRGLVGVQGSGPDLASCCTTSGHRRVDALLVQVVAWIPLSARFGPPSGESAPSPRAKSCALAERRGRIAPLPCSWAVASVSRQVFLSLGLKSCQAYVELAGSASCACRWPLCGAGLYPWPDRTVGSISAAVDPFSTLSPNLQRASAAIDGYLGTDIHIGPARPRRAECGDVVFQ